MHQLTGDFYTVGEILGHTLKGIGMSLGISTNLEAVTAQYVNVRLERKRAVLETYHKALHPQKPTPDKGREPDVYKRQLLSCLLYIIRDKKAIDLSLFLKGSQERISLYVMAKQRMVLFPRAAESTLAAFAAQVIHKVRDHHRYDDKLPDTGIFRKRLGLSLIHI